MIVVTGASDNHFLTLINMISSFMHHNENNHLIIYNLGLSDDKWHNIQQKFNHPSLSFKVFDYSKYPEWFNIQIEAGQYAWKPTILYNTFLDHPDEKIVWMDAGNLIQNLKELENFLDQHEVYSGTSDGTIEKWTFPDTIKYMKCTWTDRENRNAACLGFNCKTEKAKDIIKEFHDLAQIKECIAPEGSSRKNHRQDQAVFSILFYKYNCFNFCNKDWKHHLGYSIHNDIDPH
jgi:hypothetical protein